MASQRLLLLLIQHQALQLNQHQALQLMHLHTDKVGQQVEVPSDEHQCIQLLRP